MTPRHRWLCSARLRPSRVLPTPHRYAGIAARLLGIPALRLPTAAAGTPYAPGRASVARGDHRREENPPPRDAPHPPDRTPEAGGVTPPCTPRRGGLNSPPPPSPAPPAGGS